MERIRAQFTYSGTGSLQEPAWAALEKAARALGKKVIGISLIRVDRVCIVEGDVT